MMPVLTSGLLSLLRDVEAGRVMREDDGTDVRVNGYWGVAPDTTEVASDLARLDVYGWVELVESRNGLGDVLRQWVLTDAGCEALDGASRKAGS
jgi:hypothetical protein